MGYFQVNLVVKVCEIKFIIIFVQVVEVVLVNLGIVIDNLSLVSKKSSIEFIFKAGDFLEMDILVCFVYFVVCNGDFILSWEVGFYIKDENYYWLMKFLVKDGCEIVCKDMVIYCMFVKEGQEYMYVYMYECGMEVEDKLVVMVFVDYVVNNSVVVMFGVNFYCVFDVFIEVLFFGDCILVVVLGDFEVFLLGWYNDGLL